MPIRSSFKLNNFIGRAQKKLNAAQQANLLTAVQIWHGGIVEELGGPRSGRLYRVPGTGNVKPVPTKITIKKGPRAGTTYTANVRKYVGARMYTASAPGEAPASRLGQLRQSYRFRVRVNLGEVGSPLERSIWLEKGTARIKPRPHVQTAYDKNRPDILKAIGKKIED